MSDTDKQSERHASHRDRIFAMIDELDAGELGELIEAAGKKRQERQETAMRELVAEFEEKAAKLGLSLPKLLSVGRGRPAGQDGKDRKKVAAKFKGPNGEAWTGRGRTPSWLHALEQTGRKREEFAVNRQ